jgi:hypothetical protein
MWPWPDAHDSWREPRMEGFVCSHLYERSGVVHLDMYFKSCSSLILLLPDTTLYLYESAFTGPSGTKTIFTFWCAGLLFILFATMHYELLLVAAKRFGERGGQRNKRILAEEKSDRLTISMAWETTCVRRECMVPGSINVVVLVSQRKHMHGVLLHLFGGYGVLRCVTRMF